MLQLAELEVGRWQCSHRWKEGRSFDGRLWSLPSSTQERKSDIMAPWRPAGGHDCSLSQALLQGPRLGREQVGQLHPESSGATDYIHPPPNSGYSRKCWNVWQSSQWPRTRVPLACILLSLDTPSEVLWKELLGMRYRNALVYRSVLVCFGLIICGRVRCMGSHGRYFWLCRTWSLCCSYSTLQL